MDLTEFLLEPIAEDEAVAQRAVERRNAEVARGVNVEGREPQPDTSLFGWDDWVGGPGVGMGAERLLAEGQAKRRFMARRPALDASWHALEIVHAEAQRQLEYVWRPIALPCADHPDYEDAWRP